MKKDILMKKFDMLKHNGTCECCNKPKDVVVVSSIFAPISFSVCKECLMKGLEPYKYLVPAIAGYRYPLEINDKYLGKIRNILKGYGKTEEEFIIDMDNLRR